MRTSIEESLADRPGGHFARSRCERDTARLGSDRGSEWPRHVIDDSSRGADGVRLADVNGDGLPDIATGWEEGGRVRVYLHPGPQHSKQAWPAVTVGEVASPEDAVFADLDGDGAVDVISSCEGKTQSLFVHWAPPEPRRLLDAASWRTEAIPAARKTQAWMYCLPLQVDGRHGLDLVCGSKNRGAQIGWFESPQNPRDLAAWTWRPIDEAGWIMSLEAIDVDADGDFDVVASDRKGPRRGVRWLENPGPGSKQFAKWPTHDIGGADKEVMFLKATDLAGDGRLDFVAAVKDGDILYLRQTSQQPPAWEEHAIAMPQQTGTGKGINVGDVNLDGRPDIVFSCEHAQGKSGVIWLSYSQAPTQRDWTAHEISGRQDGVKFDLVELLDLDADGDLDVLTCEERDNLGVIWYENPTR